jgi:hypothetical protein
MKRRKHRTIKKAKKQQKQTRVHHKRTTRTARTTKKQLKGGKSLKTEPTAENAQNAILTKKDLEHDDNEMLSKDDKSFNTNPYVRESHNCYTYFLNMKSQSAVDLCIKDYKNHNMCRRAQPGYVSGHKILKKTDYTCPIIEQRTLDDNPNIYKISSNDMDCKPQFYKGALVVAPERDYHYYRQDDDAYGYWSHKPGYKPSTMRDSDGNLIRDPKKAARNYSSGLNYKDFCGYYCVPRSTNKKFMAHKGEKLDFDNRKLIEMALENYEKKKGKIKAKVNENMDAIYKEMALKVKNKLSGNT